MLNAVINFLIEPYGVCRVVGFENIYRSGFFHRAGKPGMYDRHPGDLYASRADALADVDPNAQHLYVATVKVVWYEEHAPHVNCAGSQPVPVSESRRKLARDPQGGYVDGVWHEGPLPLTVQERELQLAQALAFGWRY